MTLLSSADEQASPLLTTLLQRSDDYNVARFMETNDSMLVSEVLARVRSLDELAVAEALEHALVNFGERHYELRTLWRLHTERLTHMVPEIAELDSPRSDLLGAYFTMEYSLASAALFNPSIVLHPNQSDTASADRSRVLLSLRAVGEGHVSSILFREGWVEPDGNLTLDEVSPPWKPYGIVGEGTGSACGLKHESAATFDDEGRIMQVEQSSAPPPLEYEVSVDPDLPLSKCVLLPVQHSEKNGMEDLRLVEFAEGDKKIYYGTYTAYNGRVYWPQLIETDDFRRIRIKRLRGKFSTDKGMALFPRRINGRYAMISRHDSRQMHVAWSDHVDTWDECQPLTRPWMPWEFHKTGNCGSPIETEHGWLLLTHGVGAMRQYCIGALLLDLEEPARVLRYTPEPLLRPPTALRNGYVPNVVYTCGGLLHNGRLTIPVGIADLSIAVATFEVDALIKLMQHCRATEATRI